MKAAEQQEGAAVADPAVGQEQQQEAAPPPPPRAKAVLVLGATGRLGRRVVQQVRALTSGWPGGSAAGGVAGGGQGSWGQAVRCRWARRMYSKAGPCAAVQRLLIGVRNPVVAVAVWVVAWPTAHPTARPTRRTLLPLVVLRRPVNHPYTSIWPRGTPQSTKQRRPVPASGFVIPL